MSGDTIRRLRRPEASEEAPGRRWKTNWPAELSSPQARARCVVLDISSWGARVSLDTAVDLSGRVWLTIEGIGTIAAQIAWRRDEAVGLQFLEQQAWIRRLHTRQLDPTTWRAAGFPPRS
jgi:hypothetical protein